MKTNNIVWIADGFKREEKEAAIVYYDKDGDEIWMNRESIDFLVAIHFQRLEEYITVLRKADELSDTHEKNLKTIIAAAENEIIAHCRIVREHLGTIQVERSDDEVVGCVMELRQATG